VSRADWRVARYRARATSRQRRSQFLSLALLIGLLGGLAIGSVAAGRRTQSAYPEFLSSTNPSQVDISVFPPNLSSGAPSYSPAFVQEVGRIPGVAHVSTGVVLQGVPLGPDGAPRLGTTGEITAVGSVNGAYFDQDRLTPVQGRTADPQRADEFMMTAAAAHLLGFHVGETIPYGFIDPTQTPPPVLVTLRLRLVGLVTLNDQVVEDDVDAVPTFVIFTPATTAQVSSAYAADGITGVAAIVYDLRLRTPATDVGPIERAFVQDLPAGAEFQFHVFAPAVTKVEQSVRPVSIALAAFGLFVAAAGLLIAGQAIARQVRASAPERAALRALGAPPTVTMVDALSTPVLAILAGSILAVALAVAVSPIAPLGVVRGVYPYKGIAADWTVLGAGLGVLVLGLGAWSVIVAYRWAPQRGRPAPTPSRSVGRLQSLAAASPLGPSATVGIGFAFDSGARGSGMPSRSAMLGAALAVGAMVVTLTFGSGLSTLVSTPAYYGWNWSYLLDASNNVPPQAVALLSKDPRVAGWAGVDDSQLSIDGQSVPILAWDPTGTVTAPVLSGHWLTSDSEIMLGPTTLAALGKHIGDTVVISYGTPQDPQIYLAPIRLTIAGTATMPAIGYVSQVADHASMGSGAIVDNGLAGATALEGNNNPDPTLNGPNTVVVRLRPGISAAAGRADMQHIADVANAAFNADPNGIGNNVFVLPVQRPAQIVNFRSMGATPALLAGGLALGAVIALGLTLASSVRRRRRDLALLKTLGFTTRQLGAAVAWQASGAAVVGLVVGVPLGIAAGRQLWILFARSIAAVPHPTVPLLAVAIVAAGALVFANAVAALPARVAARTPAAEVLRSE